MEDYIKCQKTSINVYVFIYSLQRYLYRAFINSMIEEKKAQIASYLRNKVSPFITALMEDISRKRPDDIAQFTKAYAQKIIAERKTSQNKSDSQEEEDKEEVNRKFQQKMKLKKNQKKLSRQAISAQSYGQFNKRTEYVAQVIPKSLQTKNSIKRLIKTSVLFANLSEGDIQVVVDAMTIKNVESGEQVIKQGDEGFSLYVVDSGQYDCSKIIKGVETYLKTYKSGDAFGELALMYSAPRAASIKCKYSGTLYQLDRATFKHVTSNSANKTRSKLKQFFSKVSILQEIDPAEKDKLCDIMKQETFKKSECIVRQGEQGNKFYLITEGYLIAQKQGKKVYEFKQGDYFGEIALVRNIPRQATVRCMTDCKVMSVDRETFKRMMGSIQGILKRNESKYKQYMLSN